jgi:murein DD-endopeptidase MepM/ murein hydrolase activator NlpD
MTRLEPPDQPRQTVAPAERQSWLMTGWEYVSRAGMAEIALRLGTHVLLIALIFGFAWGLREFYLQAQVVRPAGGLTFAAALPQSTATPLPVALPAFQSVDLVRNQAIQPQSGGLANPEAGVVRKARLHTDVPSRQREEVITYVVKPGDTLFGIAAKFGLKPETILWANQFVLGDNPHSLRPGQELNILPVDGAYHRWSAGDGLNGVARFFGVTPEAIVQFPGNHLDPVALGDWSNPNIEPGAWLIIPGGRREFVSWSAPVIPLDNPAVAKVLGPGACETVAVGVAGSGAFIWPADNHYLSGYDYEPEANHPGIDIDGFEGSPVYATDSGIVVYAGWNNWGYGNTVVINHGNGWQTLYAHLSAYYVSCGQSIFQGNTLGAIGSTGNATGSHLHFEMMYNGVKVNPHNYIR